MDEIQTTVLPRKGIAIRLLYTFFFLIVFEILKIIVQVTVVFQYIYLFITRTYSEPLRRFSNKVSVYAYRVPKGNGSARATGPFRVDLGGTRGTSGQQEGRY